MRLITIAAFILFSFTNIMAMGYSQLTVEELRIDKAKSSMPEVIDRFEDNIAQFNSQLSQIKTDESLRRVVDIHANELWQKAVSAYSTHNDFDDRPLYWARLQMTRDLRLSKVFKTLNSKQQEKLLWQLELLSRGQKDIHFDKSSNKKILLTGFDPFFLDRNINQSNPSGVVAMALDGRVITYNGITVEIETLIVPVRFEDFDKGMIEELLTPYFKNKSVDMVITVSMGRDDFDLERFPGRRRSAKAPGNLNIFTGATAENPLVPRLKNHQLEGPEFVEFSLPSSLMLKANGDFNINDNHKVMTLNKTFSPDTLSELSEQVSVQGSGGGYLSNEISYRSLLLRDKYNPTLPVGHIHTPRFKGFDPEKTKKIIQQIQSMISMTLSTK